jgi:hypothetical protein
MKLPQNTASMGLGFISNEPSKCKAHVKIETVHLLRNKEKQTTVKFKYKTQEVRNIA